jgi:hypothetical protein
MSIPKSADYEYAVPTLEWMPDNPANPRGYFDELVLLIDGKVLPTTSATVYPAHGKWVVRLEIWVDELPPYPYEKLRPKKGA